MAGHPNTGYSSITGLGRNLDPGLTSNRIAVGGGVVAFVVMAGLSFVRDDLTLIGAVFAAVAVFLGWALGRELEPDLPSMATVSMVISLIFTVFVVPSAIAVGIALIAIRLVAGTVGASLKAFDIPVLVGVGFLAASDPALWIVGLAAGAWVWAAPEVGPLRRITAVAYGISVVAGLGLAAWRFWGTGDLSFDVTQTAYVLAAAAGAAMLVSARRIQVSSLCDAGDAAIDRERVRLARVTVGSILMWAAMVGGVDAFWSLGPVFAALLTAAVYRVFVHPASVPT
ncbi:MAG TPA: hypothetical protein VLA29_12495 [Acidimicrobiia bacterium]|nr:hypothetical protein [Acidimicrobiia bacterium]